MDLSNLDGVRESDDRSEWERAMDIEIQNLHSNGTFVEVRLPMGCKASRDVKEKD